MHLWYWSCRRSSYGGSPGATHDCCWSMTCDFARSCRYSIGCRCSIRSRGWGITLRTSCIALPILYENLLHRSEGILRLINLSLSCGRVASVQLRIMIQRLVELLLCSSMCVLTHMWLQKLRLVRNDGLDDSRKRLRRRGLLGWHAIAIGRL